MRREIIGIDFFAGCGGLTFGLQEAGIKVVKGIDIDPTVEETYVANNPNTIFVNADIRNLKARDVMKNVKRKGKYLLISGCAPCQPFSQHNRHSDYDRRKSLVLNFGRLIEEILPEFVLAENVPGFMNENNRYRKEFLEILEMNGYQYSEDIVNAADYGVPQIRRRYVLVASRLGKIELPKKTHGEGKRKYVTVKQIIKKYPPIKAGESCDEVPNHVSNTMEEINLKRIRLIPKNGGSRKSLPSKLGLNCHKNHKGHSDVYGRMKWEKPAPTLTCRCTNFTNGRFGHPVQNRSISVREAAALQTFPDSYIFYGLRTIIARHVGNAVPVLMAKKFGQAFLVC